MSAEQEDHGPTDRVSYRYGIASGLWAAAVIVERQAYDVPQYVREALHKAASAIREYERKTTNIRFESDPKIPQMTPADLGYGEMQPEDLGLTNWPSLGGVIRDDLRDGGLWDQLTPVQRAAALAHPGPVGSGTASLPHKRPEGASS